METEKEVKCWKTGFRSGLALGISIAALIISVLALRL